MTDLLWQEPPPAKRSVPKWAAVIEALRENPGEWAVFKDQAIGMGSYLRKRYPGIEVTTRSEGHPKGRADIFIRVAPDAT